MNDLSLVSTTYKKLITKCKSLIISSCAFLLVLSMIGAFTYTYESYAKEYKNNTNQNQIEKNTKDIKMLLELHGLLDKTTEQEPAKMPNFKEAYEDAFALAMNDKPQEASLAFAHYLKSYPQSPLKKDALYWLGFSYYMSDKFTHALRIMSQLIAMDLDLDDPDFIYEEDEEIYQEELQDYYNKDQYIIDEMEIKKITIDWTQVKRKINAYIIIAKSYHALKEEQNACNTLVKVEKKYKSYVEFLPDLFGQIKGLKKSFACS